MARGQRGARPGSTGRGRDQPENRFDHQTIASIMSDWEEGSEAYWDALKNPERYDAARAREQAERTRLMSRGTAIGVVGAVLQAGCWGGALTHRSNENLGFVLILAAGCIGLWLLALGRGMRAVGKQITVRRPRPDPAAELESKRRIVASSRAEVTARLVEHVRSWVERTASYVIVSGQPETTQRLGARLTELKREVKALADRADTLVRREFGDDRMWDTSDWYAGGRERWEEGCDRITRELKHLLNRYGYDQQVTPLACSAVSLVDGYRRHTDKLRELQRGNATFDARRAWETA